MSYTIEKSRKLDEIESLTSEIVRFRIEQYNGDDSNFDYRYDRLLGEALEQAGNHRLRDILHLQPIQKMDEMLAYLYSEMELDRKHDASGTKYNGPTTDAIESSIKEYQSSVDYQKDVEEYRQWYEDPFNMSDFPTSARENERGQEAD